MAKNIIYYHVISILANVGIKWLLSVLCRCGWVSSPKRAPILRSGPTPSLVRPRGWHPERAIRGMIEWWSRPGHPGAPHPLAGHRILALVPYHSGYSYLVDALIKTSFVSIVGITLRNDWADTARHPGGRHRIGRNELSTYLVRLERKVKACDIAVPTPGHGKRAGMVL